MNDPGHRALELRKLFDQAFSLPPPAAGEKVEALLAISIGNRPHAVRLGDISALVCDKRITPLPTSVPDLLGVAAFRSNLTAVYDLHALMGYGPCPEMPRWMIVSAGPIRVALAFQGFDGDLRVPISSIVAEQGPRNLGGMVTESNGHLRPLLRVSAIAESIQSRIGKGAENG